MNNALFIAIKPALWQSVYQTTDIYYLINRFLQTTPNLSLPPRPITFKFKAKAIILMNRKLLAHMFNFKLHKRTINYFVKMLKMPPNSTLKILNLATIKNHWLNTIQLNSITVSPVYNNKINTPNIHMQCLPIYALQSSNWLLHEEYMYDKLKFLPKTLWQSPTYYQDIYATAARPKSPALFKQIMHLYDLARRTEIDYSAMSYKLILTRTAGMYDWQGSLYYLHWNFTNVYNWKYYF